MRLDEKIAKVSSYVFALAIMAFLLYLVFTVKWVLYLFALSNILVIGGLFVMVSRELISVMGNPTDQD